MSSSKMNSSTISSFPSPFLPMTTQLSFPPHILIFLLLVFHVLMIVLVLVLALLLLLAFRCRSKAHLVFFSREILFFFYKDFLAMQPLSVTGMGVK